MNLQLLKDSICHGQHLAPRCAGPSATSSAPRTTQHRQSQRMALRPCCVVGRNLTNNFEVHMEIMTMPGADGCFQSVDDGGDATFLVHKGKELEEKYANDGSLPVAVNRSPSSI